MRRTLPALIRILLLGLGLCQAGASEVCLDLASSANRAFVDPGEGAPVRGWSLQGSENSLAGMKSGPCRFSGIGFSILDGAKNGKREVVAFDGARGGAGLSRIDIPVGDGAPDEGSALYLLHTACWLQASDASRIGLVTVRYAGGRTAEFPIRNRHELADWWGPSDLDNGVVAYRESNKTAEVGVYLSRFPLPKGLGRPVSVSLQSDGQGPLWIVIAATISSRDLPLPGPDSWTVTSGDQWKPLDTSRLGIVPGSALDLSPLFPQTEEAGGEGFARIDGKGRIVFERQPDRPVRFFCDMSQMTFLKTITPEKAERYADQVAREGYNIYRPQFLDLALMQGSGKDASLDPGQLDRWDLLAAALKKRGVYLCLDLVSYDGSYYAIQGNPWGPEADAKRLRSRLYYDEAARMHWREAMLRFLGHVNPYTGVALKDEPQVAIMEMRNEAFLEFLMATRGRNPDIVLPFRTWLKKRYGTTESLREAWSRKSGTTETSFLPPDQTVETVSLPTFYSDDPPSRDLHRFYGDMERETFQWMSSTLRAMGVRALLTDYNAGGSLQEQLTRDIVPMAENHAYHDLPSNDVNPGSTISNVSSLPGGIGSYRYLAGTRQWGRPYLCTEWDHCFWNGYRYEAGLTFPAYAALQGWDMLTHMGSRDELEAKPLRSTVISIDPPLKASEYMAALFYRRGDVQASPHRIEVKIDPGPAGTALPLERSLSSAITRLALVAGLGVRIDGDADGAPRAPYHADWSLTPDGGEAIVTQGGEQKTVGNGAAPGDRQADFNSKLRGSGILSPGNRTDLAGGFYESDTGQIRLNEARGQISVVTPYSQGIALNESADAGSLPGLAIKKEIGMGLSVFVGSLTPQPLPQSGRLLLIVATDALNSGMSFADPQRHKLIQPGSLPVLVRTARVEIQLKHARAERLRLWALGLNGARSEEIPLQSSAEGVAAVIDTGKLQNGPTPFFEVAEDMTQTRAP